MNRLIKLLLVLTVLVLGLSACGQTTTQQTQPTPQTVRETVVVPAEKITVRLSGWASSPAETALLESLLYKFSVENPDILVKYEPITGDYKQVLLTSIASGTEPDIFYVDIFWWLELAANDALLPLDDSDGDQWCFA
jgi:multiple sugar transport system substrate-binding protein